ncbi:MAG: multidrug effflux MFS transporter [Pseudomonadota bacterium]
MGDDSRLPISRTEFVALMAMITSIMALSIDAMLPALPDIAATFALTNINDVQFVLVAMFAGFAFGQVFAGPLSDHFGRKPLIYFGFVIYIIGGILALIANDFLLLLFGRVCQGMGAGTVRIVSVALVRDCLSGRQMASIMSNIMAIFILVPTFAPFLGQVVLWFGHWRHIFAMLLGIAIIAAIWFHLRMGETIRTKRPLAVRSIKDGIVEALSDRVFVGYTVMSGLIFGAFMGYLNSAQQLFQVAYDTAEWFPAYFGMTALAIGAAGLFNARFVVAFGTEFMIKYALCGMAGLSSCMAVFLLFASAPLWLFLLWVLLLFFAVGVLFGSLQARALVSMGHIAGLTSALSGSLSTFLGLPLGWVVGAAFSGSIFPVVIGFAIISVCALILFGWIVRTSKSDEKMHL